MVHKICVLAPGKGSRTNHCRVFTQHKTTFHAWRCVPATVSRLWRSKPMVHALCTSQTNFCGRVGARDFRSLENPACPEGLNVGTEHDENP